MEMSGFYSKKIYKKEQVMWVCQLCCKPQGWKKYPNPGLNSQRNIIFKRIWYEIFKCIILRALSKVHLSCPCVISTTEIACQFSCILYQHFLLETLFLQKRFLFHLSPSFFSASLSFKTALSDTTIQWKVYPVFWKLTVQESSGTYQWPRNPYK